MSQLMLRRIGGAILVVFAAGYATRIIGEEPAEPPPLKKRAVAFGYAGSEVGLDVPRNGDDKPTPGGLGVLGRFDVHGGWGLQLGYASKDDGFGGGRTLTIGQAGLHAYYAWEGYVTDTARLRFYPKFGVSRTELEESVPLSGRFRDAAIAPSFGLGVEWGDTRWGAVFDVGWTFVDAELSAGREESLNVSAGFIGLVYCF